eukprot:TRINITY_DN24425_c0_g1_i1.p1 TRINITY_DN24425_c0_g1~~TRINITY_DN24425_c0_g1_i1.p1  ORF type:complete len:320 (+),score=60.68 TRINITY_DN24425_c0_g1_i1:94-1053(+)
MAETAEATDAAGEAYHWQRDEDVSACPTCNVGFTTTVRRHHCRQCGGVFCDDCTRSRLRLPKLPNAGKVRTCDRCAAALGELNATGFEEDLEASTQIIQDLKGSLKVRYAECEAFKRILLELEAGATDDFELLERYENDPESNDYSFNILKERVAQLWASMRSRLDGRVARQTELQEQVEQALASKNAAELHESQLRARYSDVDAECGDAVRIEAERDELVRRKLELDQAVVNTRARVRELEIERQEYNERRNAAGRGGAPARGGCSRFCMRPPIFEGDADPGSSSPVPFLISGGRSDPLISGRGSNRVAGCRRACALM